MKATRICTACKVERPASGYRSPLARKCDACIGVPPKPKRCARCREEKPPADFVASGRNCAACRATPAPSASALKPRACFRCHETKPADAFPWGDGKRGRGMYRRRRSICAECVAAEEAARARKTNAWRSTWEDEGTGRLVRRCSRCREVKDLLEDFYRTTQGRKNTHGRDYRCKRCQVERISQRKRELLANPETAEQEREARRRWQREWRERNPGRYRVYRQAYRRRLQADPDRRAAYLESQRMTYRLRQMANGRSNLRSLSRTRSGPVLRTVAAEHTGRLSAPPLARRIMALVRGVVEIEDVCADLGIDPRQLLAWRSGEIEAVQLDTVERVLTRAGWHWWDVYGDEPAEVRTKAARLLAGEVVAA